MRAESLNLLLESKTINSMDIIMNHLDDTALIVRDVGEFGVDYISVSDYMLYQARWKNRADKVKTIDKVLSQHNYLRSAHLLLQYLAPEEKYYAYIKNMATRNRKRDSYTGTEINLEEREAALFCLAKFKKKEDIPLIKKQLIENISGIEWLSFELMKKFPDTSYLGVYEEYYPHRFFVNFKFDKTSNSADFIKSIVGYKNERSAAILQAILDKKDFKLDPVYYEYIKDEIQYATWENKCKAYEHINKQYAAEMKKNDEHIFTLPVVKQYIPPDSITPPLRWLQE